MGKKNDTTKPAAAFAEMPDARNHQSTQSTPMAEVPVAPAARVEPQPPAASAPKQKALLPSKAAAGASLDGAGKTSKKKPVAKRSPVRGKSASIVFTTEEVALRAYFISEHRQQHGLDGDAHSDWIEAERQLVKESRKKKPAGKKKAAAKKV